MSDQTQAKGNAMAKWAIVFNAGIPGGSIPPDGTEPTAANIAQAVEWFRNTMREPGWSENAHAWLYPAECWDGISYGDTGTYVLEQGERGGVRVTRV